MASDRIQRQIERFLDEAEDAVAHGDWGTAKDCAEKVFAFDPENSDGLAFLSAAARSLSGTEATPPGVDHSGTRAAAQDGSSEQPTSFANGRYQVQAISGRGRQEESLSGLASGVFVGRQRKMRELKACLEDALSGRGRLAKLVGKPGIGKTRTAN